MPFISSNKWEKIDANKHTNLERVRAGESKILNIRKIKQKEHYSFYIVFSHSAEAYFVSVKGFKIFK